MGLCCVAAGSLSSTAARAAEPAAEPSDVDGNGVSDLVVGVPGEDVGSVQDVGKIMVARAGAGGVGTSAGAWSQDAVGVKGRGAGGDRFGEALASGDFDRDGYADVAVGAPGESVGGARRAGSVTVLYGSPAGVIARDQLWSQGQHRSAGRQRGWRPVGP